jgi:DNA-binding transcriptional ArsR family regulator
VLAALALAGPEGLADPVLFEAAWGFEYEAGIHRGVLQVQLHRARKRLGSLGAIQTTDGVTRLLLTAPLLISDPRCAPPVNERVLQLIASRPGLGTNEIVAELGIPTRTVQSALSQLVDHGICLRERRGKRVLYRVEDTTFQEPTRR